MIRAVIALVAATLTAAAGVYREGPPPGHTGAFGEPDCGACHFDAPRDDDAGDLRLDVPAGYRPGATYHVTLELSHPELAAAGFQLAVRHAEGQDAGSQAGRLEPVDLRTRVETGDNGVSYASHSEAGVEPSSDRATAWTLRWTAPEGVCPVGAAP
ncbi:MAG: hypothetical protein P8177_02115 [Gemmatimonadota bacterium]